MRPEHAISAWSGIQAAPLCPPIRHLPFSVFSFVAHWHQVQIRVESVSHKSIFEKIQFHPRPDLRLARFHSCLHPVSQKIGPLVPKVRVSSRALPALGAVLHLFLGPWQRQAKQRRVLRAKPSQARPSKLCKGKETRKGMQKQSFDKYSVTQREKLSHWVHERRADDKNLSLPLLL